MDIPKILKKFIWTPIFRSIRSPWFHFLHNTLEFKTIASLIIFIGLTFICIKRGYVDNATFVNNKDLLEAISYVIQSVVLIGAAFFSYFRFFKGRLLYSRLNCDIIGNILKFNDDSNLVVINLKIENKGNISIDNLQIRYSIYDLTSKVEIKKDDVNSQLLKLDETGLLKQAR